MASARSAEMAGRDATYGHSGPDANYVGLLGELAAQRWIERQGEVVNELYRHPDAASDLQLASNGMTLEVKTNRLPAWQTYGASIALRQVDTISNTGGLIWCVTSPDLPPSAVYLMGWVPAPELVERVEPRFNRGRVLLRIAHLDSMTTCLDWLAAHIERTRWARNQATYVCARGHQGILSICLDCWWSELGGPELRRIAGTAHAVQCSAVRSFSWGTGLHEALCQLTQCSACMPAALAGVEATWRNRHPAGQA